MSDSLSLGSVANLPVMRPTSVAEVGRMVQDARGQRQAVYPVGGRTMLDIGLPPKKPGIAIDTTALTSVIDYPARDMTVTVLAGITLAELGRVLAKENQWLPIDVPLPQRATLGGAVATNASGPHRYGYGTLRDYVIGLSFISDDGVEVKGGGRVVKNVAGYDFMKLQTGALGTLGILTQLTLKVKPRPEASLALAFGCTAAELGAMLDLLHKSNSRPVAVELLNAAAWQALGLSPHVKFGEWVLVVGFEEKRTTVEWQRTTLLNELAALNKHPAEYSSLALDKLWSAIADLQIRPDSAFIGKASVRPSAVADFANRATRGDGLVHGQPLNGIVWLHSEELPGSEFAIRRGATKTAKTGNDWELMKHVKRTLDPDDVFNPGRLW